MSDIIAISAAQLKVCNTLYFDVPGIREKNCKADKIAIEQSSYRTGLSEQRCIQYLILCLHFPVPGTTIDVLW
jgi:hypothetical protein